ncbi:MAG: DUF2062 domain-containing protein [Deltaproteobacteria bacterium]|nr:DUF2062 domain-containing protein [Deltaproteobacteria bacterium]
MPRLRELVSRLWTEHTTPLRLGAAVGLGVLVGCSPFFGLQAVIAVGLAFVLRLNKVAALLGSQVSIPPLAPFIGLASVELGSWLVTGSFAPLAVADFRWGALRDTVSRFALFWLVGSVLVGAVLGTLAFAATAAIVRWRRSRGGE